MKIVQLNDSQITPNKIICIGRNYVAHIAELDNEVPDEMVIFLKPNSAISHKLSACHQETLHYEAELCFIYQQGRFSAVGFGLDLTKRGLQSKLKVKGLPWERAKAFNGSAIFSDFVSINNIDSSLSLELKIDGEIIQSGGVALMMYKPDEILKEILTFMDLQDGDIVMTGTPKGVGVIHSGSCFEGRILNKEVELVKKCWIAV
ncbi:fumarylacetoacetate hydrolase family protein [Pseudoalteromonas denitrificans]|uniref:2-keto-4-pentenoate hydratase/2-oxohepta-3-ene-1,7-dioic acid hydratase (Catechol pathway) n=1 Tax=Pseudoalteromonas denitrificans DSM 6059 TaxID=1123010 RepID=A0A1I1EY77_9GAMM|nr:fumarylacetoacetate hydrolase family protein [Pseudoalteromonas denitrificans]SFB89900.1 2-keto-4-pentenoate hydratase/2-oxohepta-3-ene-1,7-dioic acid hydratase (catechol pathway) [Pseudoalteromonas denitrificans DSM 6059]